MEKKNRTWKRINRLAVIICAFVFMMAMGITALATADPGTTIYVKGDNTNIRSEASTDSAVVGQLNANAPLTVQSVTSSADGHNWYQVTCVINGETKTGYIREDLVEIPADTGEATEGETGEGEAPVEETPAAETPAAETPAASENTGNSGLSGIGELTPMESETVPQNLAATFRSVEIEINGLTIPAWADETNEYYIFYATTASGNTGWYLYDKVSGGYVRYSDFMGGGAVAASATVSGNGEGEGVSKTAFIVVIVICVILVVVTLVMGIKLMNGGGQDDYDYDDDDYDDDDYEDEDEPRTRRSSIFKKFSRSDDDD